MVSWLLSLRIVSVSVFFLPSVKLSHILGWGFCSSTSGQDLELELALFQLQDIDAIARSERERIPEPLESQRIWETLNQLSKATYHIYGWRTSPRAHLRSTLSQGPDKTERSRSQPPHLSTPQEKKEKRKKKKKRKEGKKETPPFGMRPRCRRLH
ncbi:hypothetical protein I7I53_09417 [Histoplasma capsulatum var. duboisii H88]|uniref:Uncharacterized protein n=1 Tax=Ajellomyces capsulatus (strain H88) TaxID=544711 RepID=A0A8A1LAQ4_AJEC8|nr:hypothetical protein I7I53_09417 [Histoplasma capsulatum var. duboisii H88]